MADVTSPPPEADAGDGLRTIQLSGGAPFGFRLSDGGQGRLVVSKVRRFGPRTPCFGRLLALLGGSNNPRWLKAPQRG